MCLNIYLQSNQFNFLITNLYRKSKYIYYSIKSLQRNTSKYEQTSWHPFKRCFKTLFLSVCCPFNSISIKLYKYLIYLILNVLVFLYL